ncbi:hypothetical protein CL618_03665, partial [archaeon]|nr:hypothetical protein [archaeon]
MKDHKILIALAVILVVTLYFSDFTNISGSAVVSKCNDGIDNDGDDYIDSLDMGCADGIGGERTRCQDGKDNDNDGKIDLADPHCIDVQDDNEKGGKCEDGIDNDGDDYIDFPQDKGCSDMNDGETSRCQDDVDNDRDGFTDLADSGCQNIQDDNERCEADSECNINCLATETATCSTEG